MNAMHLFNQRFIQPKHNKPGGYRDYSKNHKEGGNRILLCDAVYQASGKAC
jgi:hypothetical protein